MLKVEIQVYFGFSPKLINAWGIENYTLVTSPVVSALPHRQFYTRFSGSRRCMKWFLRPSRALTILRIIEIRRRRSDPIPLLHSL